RGGSSSARQALSHPAMPVAVGDSGLFPQWGPFAGGVIPTPPHHRDGQGNVSTRAVGAVKGSPARVALTKSRIKIVSHTLSVSFRFCHSVHTYSIAKKPA